MNRREALIDRDIESDEGFGPGTDLLASMLALLLLILTALRLTTVAALGGEFDPHFVEANKEALVASLERAFGAPANVSPTAHDVQIIHAVGGAIIIRDFATMQRISFGESILFDLGQHELSGRGRQAIARLRGVLAERASGFMEIQISGHTDTAGEAGYNLNLGADRAMAVYQDLGRQGALDPARVLISATTYGEFSPTSRNPRRDFNTRQLENANATDERRRANRRIEIVLVYRLAASDDGSTRLPSQNAAVRQ